MSGATRLHAFYNGGSRGGAKDGDAREESVKDAVKLREEARVNYFGRFVHIGDAYCKGSFTKDPLNPPTTMTSLPVIVDNDRFFFCASPFSYLFSFSRCNRPSSFSFFSSLFLFFFCNARVVAKYLADKKKEEQSNLVHFLLYIMK